MTEKLECQCYPSFDMCICNLDEQIAMLIERLGDKSGKPKQIILCTNPDTPSWMSKWWKNEA